MGLSHHSAPVSLLEAVAVSESERDGLTEELIAGENVDEAMIVTTCNRVEVYSAVDAFHPALDDVVTLLGEMVLQLRRELEARVIGRDVDAHAPILGARYRSRSAI